MSRNNNALKLNQFIVQA